MKVLLINGSAKEASCTFTALSHVAKILEQSGVACEIVQLGGEPIRDCTGCLACRQLDNQCVHDDDMINAIIKKAEQADGFVFGSPVYYAHPSGRLLSALDRIFYAGSSVFAHKPGFAVVSARRAGTTASFDVINKYFTLAQMPIVSSTYWNMVHGAKPDDVLQDKEGIQTMENAANNMVWMLSCIEAGKQIGINPPVAKRDFRTNFIQ